MTTTTDVSTIPPIGYAEAARLAEAEYDLLVRVVEGLAPGDWTRPTDCEGWTVRDLAGHLVGAMRAAASFRELLSQQREITKRVKANGGNQVDVMTEVQIDRAATQQCRRRRCRRNCAVSCPSRHAAAGARRG